MTSMAVIADDFTGALDTGVQFSNKKARVVVVTADQYRAGGSFSGYDIVVVDAETRHLPPEKAYKETLSLAKLARKYETAVLYVKIDSGLRGNVGASICAAMRGFGARFTAFAPAFPEMNRVTAGGIQYINGVPIDESVFGHDPFDPVRVRHIRDLFTDWDTAVREYPRGGPYDTRCASQTVGIFDVQDSEDFYRILHHFSNEAEMPLFAGCAGFAAAIEPYLCLDGEKIRPPAVQKSLLVVSGSLNPITRSQLEYSERCGSRRVHLDVQDLRPDYFSTPAGSQWLDEVRALMNRGETVLIDTFTSNPPESENFTPEARRGTADKLGSLVKVLLGDDSACNYFLMVIGGDTLMGYISQRPDAQTVPVCELMPGVVLFSISEPGHDKLYLASKSGGFGSEDLFQKVEERLCAKEIKA